MYIHGLIKAKDQVCNLHWNTSPDLLWLKFFFSIVQFLVLILLVIVIVRHRGPCDSWKCVSERRVRLLLALCSLSTLGLYTCHADINKCSDLASDFVRHQLHVLGKETLHARFSLKVKMEQITDEYLNNYASNDENASSAHIFFSGG